MNEVTIPLKMTGLGAIKAELRDLKGQIAEATDPEQMARLAMRAGELKDQLKDANEAVNAFATGSKFEQVSNSLGGVKDSLLSLDFEEAQGKAKMFATSLGSIKPGEMGKAFGGLLGVIKTVGMAFVSLGATILANPIFLLVAVIIAIVAAVLMFLHKIGVLQKILDVIMIPINILIQGLKDLSDWLGLSSYAAEENADKMMKANEKVMESSKKRAERISIYYDQEIAMAKINGRDTFQLELDKSKHLEKESHKRKASAQMAFRAMRALDGEEYAKKREDLRKQISAENALIRAGQNERRRIKAQERVDDRNEEEKKNKEIEDAAKAAAEKARERAKQYAANRLKAGRELRDYELSQIKDAGEREIAITQEKYARLLNDLKKDETKTAAEKLKYQTMYNDMLKIELDKIEADKVQKAKDNAKKADETISDLQLQLMEEGTAKELAMTKSKYDKLRAAVEADETLSAARKATIIDMYDQLEQQENTKRGEGKIKQQEALAKTLADAQLTEEQKAFQALELKYKEEQKLAEGNAALLISLEDKYIKDKNKMVADNAQKEKDARIALAVDIYKGLTDVGAMFIKDQKKLEKFNKAAALIQIGIDTALAISALVKASQANPLNSLTFGSAGAAQFTAGIIQIATNVAKAKQILTSGGTPSTGGGNTGGNTSSTSTNVAQSVPQAANLFGSANTGNQLSAGGTSTEGNMTVTAVVSETQITNVQNKIGKINKNAEL